LICALSCAELAAGPAITSSNCPMNRKWS